MYLPGLSQPLLGARVVGRVCWTAGRSGWGEGGLGGGGGFGLVRHEVAGEGVVVERGGLGVGLRRGCTFRFWQYCIP